MNNRELEDRLVKFSVGIINLAEGLNGSVSAIPLKNQIVRSGSAAALNYGEAQSAESKKDFIHKIGIVMKELRETRINLKIMDMLMDSAAKQAIDELMAENDELLAIFFKTLETAKRNQSHRSSRH